ncbi:hypothetical protein N9H37_01540 [Congregibacter sp.]|nr:hypothetical protein [Congregibacter sp.]MDA8962023.1 hypothetical protein [Congregibacter sp.]
MPISDGWLDWTRSQLKQGATVAETRNRLKEKGFTDKDIKYAFKKALSKNIYKSTMQSAAPTEQQEKLNAGPDYQAPAHPKLVRNAYGEQIIPLNQTKLQLFTIPNFLDARQCDTLIKIIRGNAHPSQVDGYERQSHMRSSRRSIKGSGTNQGSSSSPTRTISHREHLNTSVSPAPRANAPGPS